MKKKRLERYLQEHNCAFHRHGSDHDVWRRLDVKRGTTLPRHAEIDSNLIRAICRQLDIPPPAEK